MSEKFTRREWMKSAALGAAGMLLTTAPTASLGNLLSAPSSETKSNRGLIAAARAAGVTYGVAIQSDRRISKSGPDGKGTLADFIRGHSELYVPGIAFLPEHFQPKEDVFDLSLANAFIRRARADQKQFRIHCMLYPGHDPAWVHGRINRDNWREKMDLHFEVMAAVPGIKDAVNIDVVNELMEANQKATDGYRPNAWYKAAGGPDYIPYAFKKARSLFPDMPLYWCHDHTEQITDRYHVEQVAYVLSALERALKAGAPIDGYNMQGHLQFRLGFDAKRLHDFLNDITSNLGLKVIIGELDCRTGYIIGRQTDTPLPNSYSPDEYDSKAADLVKKFLHVALPFVRDSGKQLLTWGISDIDSSWEAATAQNIPDSERPLLFDHAYRPKPMRDALYASLEAVARKA
jgi:endo-1,4-beta-xylanase